jgi:hypothetical protein
MTTKRTTPPARVVTTDAEIDAAIAAGRAHAYPAAVDVRYHRANDSVVISFEDGVVVHIPRRLLQGLETATPTQLAKVTIEGPGTGLVWSALDVAHYIPDLVAGVFGTRRWMAQLGRRGGAKTSSAKTAAARANGAKGGRPRKRAVA